MKESTKQFGLSAFLLTLSAWSAYGACIDMVGMDVWLAIISLFTAGGSLLLFICACINSFEKL